MRKYLIVYPNRDYGKLMWEDLKKSNNVEFIDTPLKISSNRILQTLFKIHFSFKLNNIIELPLKGVWNQKYSLMNYKFEDNNSYVIIFTDPALCNYRKDLLSKIKKKANIKFVLVLINSFYRMKKVIQPMLECFDKIYTYDKEEADKFGFKYYPTVYSVIKIETKNIVERKRCFFVGVAKDRLSKLLAVYDKLEERGWKPEFYISGVRKKQQRQREGIIYNKWLPYTLALEKAINSECIVEIMDKNNAGVTLRTLEAICYNKKLITNNKKILQSPFYQSNYICLIDQILNIPQTFLNDEEVDYKYDGRYSPVFFVKILEEEFNKEKFNGV
ncbi:hypothetical protein [Mediterraneibacter gnavus]|uniref:hypothetical protein n=1 Tax=Mediterraneibacter gnavus TaxID=33038 RepID=UPI00232E0852|nr:hypothetical protein [Mediterraneibacter gnavus]MDB8711937.1 hypothetical protein [Mediterraneibacter gnavus]MDB8714969.1 hypothetical protein [Mediterraneibacter gnavus]